MLGKTGIELRAFSFVWCRVQIWHNCSAYLQEDTSSFERVEVGTCPVPSYRLKRVVAVSEPKKSGAVDLVSTPEETSEAALKKQKIAMSK